jgi:hypothetical protein
MPLEYPPRRLPAGWLMEYNAALYEVGGPSIDTLNVSFIIDK